MLKVAASPRTGKDQKIFVVLLSLYLLLLAFFILLNSISRFEEGKTRAALTSVTTTFATKKSGTVDPQSSGTIESEFLAPSEFLKTLASLVTTSVPAAEVETITPDRLIQISLPVESLFVEGEPRFLPEAAPILQGVVDLLARHPPGLRFEAEVVLGAAPIAPHDPDQGETLEIARAGASARELARLGLPGSRVAVGVDQGDPDRIRFLFYVRSENRPTVDLHQIAR
jgi:hypothetical protein